MRAPAVWARAGGVRHSAGARATAREGGADRVPTARTFGEGEGVRAPGPHILNFTDWELPFSSVRAAFFN